MNVTTGGGSFLYPNISSLPQTGAAGLEKKSKDSQAQPGEFGKLLDQAVAGGDGGLTRDPSGQLSQLRSPLKFSAHANQRLMERKIQLDSATMNRVNDAVDRAAAKGVEDTLVLTNGAALIVNVPNRTVVTAMDRTQLEGNVFTNIDGAVIV
jgi:flagellar operon protein